MAKKHIYLEFLYSRPILVNLNRYQISYHMSIPDEPYSMQVSGV